MGRGRSGWGGTAGWRGGGGVGGGGAGLQKLPWTKGWLSRTSAVGRHFSSTNTCLRKSLHASVTLSGSVGFVGWVAILKMAAMASYSAHGGFWVSISTTVQATLLRTNDPAELTVRILTIIILVQFLLPKLHLLRLVVKMNRIYSVSGHAVVTWTVNVFDRANIWISELFYVQCVSFQSQLSELSPDISFAAVAFPIDHFRAHPVGGASDRLDSCTRHADGLDAFAGSKVPQLYVP